MPRCWTAGPTIPSHVRRTSCCTSPAVQAAVGPATGAAASRKSGCVKTVNVGAGPMCSRRSSTRPASAAATLTFRWTYGSVDLSLAAARSIARIPRPRTVKAAMLPGRRWNAGRRGSACLTSSATSPNRPAAPAKWPPSSPVVTNKVLVLSIPCAARLAKNSANAAS